MRGARSLQIRWGLPAFLHNVQLHNVKCMSSIECCGEMDEKYLKIFNKLDLFYVYRGFMDFLRQKI